jgi:hypothetical protein
VNCDAPQLPKHPTTLRQVLELPALSCRHFSNVLAFVLFAGIFLAGASKKCRFLGIFQKVPSMPRITGRLSICLQLFSWHFQKSAGNAQYYRHFIDMPLDSLVAFLERCRQCIVLPTLYRYASSFFTGISRKVPAMHSITGTFSICL